MADKNPDITTSTKEAAAAIRRRRDEIIQEWVEMARSNVPAAQQQSRPVLVDNLPKYLTALEDRLSGNPNPLPPSIPAQHHAEERASLPEYTLPQVIEEYHLLRKVLFHCLETERLLTPEVRAVIEEFIDYGVKDSAEEFMKRNQSRLKQSEERYHLLIYGTKDLAIYRMDANGVILSWNEGAERINGYIAEEVIGRHFSLFFSPEDRERGKPEHVLRHAAETGRWEEEGWRLRKDGSRFWAGVTLTALYDDEGRLQGFSKITRDLNEQKRLEAELLESHARFRGIMEHTPALVFIKDTQGRYTYANDRWTEMFHEDAVGKTDSELFGEEAAVQFRRNDRRVMATDKPLQREESLRLEDGRTITFFVMKFPLKDAEGKVTGLCGIATDITDRKWVEEERNRLLAHSEAMRAEAEEAREQAVNILESITDGFVALDREWNFTYINETAAKVLFRLKREPEQLLGRNLWEEFPDLKDAPTAEAVRRAAAEQTVLQYERYSPQLDEWYDVRIYPSDDGVSLFFQDITERKRAEAARRESEARQTAILEAALDGFVMMDGEGRIAEFNPAAEAMFGYSRETAMGSNLADLIIPPSLREAHQLGLSRFLETGQGMIIGKRLELPAMRADGTEFPVELAITQILTDGSPLFAGFVRDISEQKRSQAGREFLLEAGDILNSSLDFTDTLDRVAHLSVSFLADFCMVDLIQDEEIQRVAVAHTNPEMERLVHDLQERFPPSQDDPTPAAQVIRSGQTLWVPEITDADLDRHTVHEEQRRIVRELGVHSYLTVPLIARGERLGAISLARTKGKPEFSLNDVILAEELATRSALAIDNSCLYQQAREAEEKLRRQLDFTHAITNSLAEGIYVINAEGKLIFINPAGENILGWTEAELRGRDMHDTVHYRHRDGSPYLRGECVFQRALILGETVYSPDDLFFRKDGTPVPVSVSVAPMRTGDRITGASFAFHDISERKQAEEALIARTRMIALSADVGAALTESPELSDALARCTDALVERMDASLARIWILDETGKTLEMKASSGLYTYLNGPHSRISVGEHKIGRIAEARQPQLTNDLFNDPHVLDREWVEREGLCAFAGYPLVVEDRVVGVAAIFSRQPISDYALDALGTTADQIAVAVERYRAEAAVRERAEQLAEADRRKDEFLAMLAHELRNPLSPILSSVKLMRLKGPDDPILQRARTVVERQARHMARMVDDLLEVSRITRGKIALRKERMNLAEALDEIVQAVLPRVEERGLEMETFLPEDSLYLDADPTRIDQIITNLLNNAVKFTEPGGKITLLAEREGDQAVIRIRDTGIGIAPELLPQIFDLFTQADRSLDRSQGGLGLGLTIVKTLVGMHGGAVTARSGGVGTGSEFVVRLPLADSAEGTASVPPEAAPSASRNLRVLVVDDSHDAADSLSEVLSLSGYETRIAYNGTAALEAAGEFKPDVILLDIGLPGMSGYEVAERLRGENGTKSFTLIALTGYGHEEGRQRARESGFDHHLTKPVDLDRLQQLLDSVAQDL